MLHRLEDQRCPRKRPGVSRLRTQAFVLTVKQSHSQRPGGHWNCDHVRERRSFSLPSLKVWVGGARCPSPRQQCGVVGCPNISSADDRIPAPIIAYYREQSRYILRPAEVPPSTDTSALSSLPWRGPRWSRSKTNQQWSRMPRASSGGTVFQTSPE